MAPRTLVSEMKSYAQEEPDRPAFIFYDKTWRKTVFTTSRLWDLCTKFAEVLGEAGVGRGDIVCNTLPNSPERVITQLGTMVAGAASLQGQLLLADGSDLKAAMERSRCKVIIVEAGNSRGAEELLNQLETKGQNGDVKYTGLPFLHKVISVDFTRGDGSFEPFSNFFTYLDEQTPYEAEVSPSDNCVVFVTSGSTGFSKLVPQPHERVLEITRIFSKVLRVNKGDVYYCDRLLGWSAGFPYFSTGWGCTRVLLDISQGVPDDEGKFTWEVVCREKCVSSYMTPVQIEKIIKDEANWKGSGHMLRTIGTGGGPLTKYQMDSIGKITEGVSTSYGASECCSISYFIVTDKESYENCNNGWPSEGVDVKIVDDNLKELPRGELGEILCRSSQTARYYLNDPENSAKTFLDDGWVRLGDLGYMSEKGQVFVFCRKSFAIHLGTYVVYPGWLEMKIKKCPGIQSVVLVGVPDVTKHEELCACLIREPGNDVTADHVHEFCKSLFLTPEGSEITPLPKHYLFFEDYPRNPNGKLERKSVKKLACQMLNIDLPNAN